jgi:hypothetical protein
MFELSIDMGVGGIVEPARSFRSKRHDPAFRKISMSISPSLHHTTDINIYHHTNLREITPASHQSMLAYREADEQVTQGYDAMIVR